MQNFMVTLLLCSAVMSALALFYMAVTPLLAKRYSAKGRYYAWLIIVVGLIIPYRPQPSDSVVKITPTNTTTPIIQIGNGAPILGPIENAITPAPPSTISLWQMAAIVWFAGVVVFLAYHFVKHYRFMTMARRWSEPITDKQALDLLQSLKVELGISRQVSFHQCLSIGSPMMVGFTHPCIFVPKLDFDRDDLYFILKHELVHYKRKDLWYRLLVMVATAIHWFNPIVSLLARSVNVLCEMSCDAEVIRSTNTNLRQHYSETIIGVVKYQSKMKTALSTNFYGGKKGMKKRIFSIMDTGKKRLGVAIICTVMILTLGTGTVFAVNAAANTSPSNEAITEEVLIGRISDSSDRSFTQDEYDLLMAQKFNGYENMSLADFNRAISEYGEKHGDAYLDAMEHVFGGISVDDPNAVFLLNTLRASGNENACKHYQSFDVRRNPEFYGIASKGEDGQLIDDTLYYEWEIIANYTVSYIVTDENNLTVSERDAFIQNFLQGMQDFVNAKSMDEWVNMTEDEIRTVFTEELDRLSTIYSNEYIQVDTAEFLGLS